MRGSISPEHTENLRDVSSNSTWDQVSADVERQEKGKVNENVKV